MESPRFLTVAALTKYLKMKFERDPHLQQIYVKGEISNFKYHSRGHMYFTLKDEYSRISAVMFQTANRTLAFTPKDGMKVLLEGNVAVYEANGSYQLYVKSMQPDGIGALYLAYEQLKEKLKEEGLFDHKWKKEIPKIPKHIGVITSPTGAAIRDILITLQRRYPLVKITVFPTLVQGENAGDSVVSSIRKANEFTDIDTIIAGRGGGSIEELWAFNEEKVARAIFESRIPIISAVGHETDTTIADFVADLRAATPTAAAEQAVPNMIELQREILQYQQRLILTIENQVDKNNTRLSRMKNSFVFTNPRRLSEPKEEQFDRLFERFKSTVSNYQKEKKSNVNSLTQRMLLVHPNNQWKLSKQSFTTLKKELQKEFSLLLQDKIKQHHLAVTKLQMLSPLLIMSKGYSIAYDEENEVITSVKSVKQDEIITLQMNDGSVKTKVLEINTRGEKEW